MVESVHFMHVTLYISTQRYGCDVVRAGGAGVSRHKRETRSCVNKIIVFTEREYIQ